MDYNHIDPAEREKSLVANTGYGDTAVLGDADALVAEQSVCVLKLRQAFFNQHATSAVPNPDPAAAAFAQQRDALDAAIVEAEGVRDRIVAETGTDVSAVMQPILDANRRNAETVHFDAEWSMNNIPGMSQAQQDDLQVCCDRADREVAVIDGWA